VIGGLSGLKYCLCWSSYAYLSWYR